MLSKSYSSIKPVGELVGRGNSKRSSKGGSDNPCSLPKPFIPRNTSADPSSPLALSVSLSADSQWATCSSLAPQAARSASAASLAARVLCSSSGLCYSLRAANSFCGFVMVVANSLCYISALASNLSVNDFICSASIVTQMSRMKTR